MATECPSSKLSALKNSKHIQLIRAPTVCSLTKQQDGSQSLHSSRFPMPLTRRHLFPPTLPPHSSSDRQRAGVETQVKVISVTHTSIHRHSITSEGAARPIWRFKMMHIYIFKSVLLEMRHKRLFLKTPSKTLFNLESRCQYAPWWAVARTHTGTIIFTPMSQSDGRAT